MKPWYESKTIWANVIAIASVMVITAIQQDLLSESFIKWWLVLQSGLNIFLRTITTDGITK